MRTFSRRPQETRHQLEPGTLDGIGWETPTRDCLLSHHLGESPGGQGEVKALETPCSGVTRRRVGKGVGAAVSLHFVLPLTAQRYRDMSRHDQAQTRTWLGGIPMAKPNGRVGLGQLDDRGRWQVFTTMHSTTQCKGLALHSATCGRGQHQDPKVQYRGRFHKTPNLTVW